MNCVQTDILINAEIYLQREVKNQTDWEKSIKEVKVCVGL
jgi:hypothetical protein